MLKRKIADLSWTFWSDSRENVYLTVPLYMGFLVEDKLEDAIIPDIDLSSLDSYSHA